MDTRMDTRMDTSLLEHDARVQPHHALEMVPMDTTHESNGEQNLFIRDAFCTQHLTVQAGMQNTYQLTIFGTKKGGRHYDAWLTRFDKEGRHYDVWLTRVDKGGRHYDAWLTRIDKEGDAMMRG